MSTASSVYFDPVQFENIPLNSDTACCFSSTKKKRWRAPWEIPVARLLILLMGFGGDEPLALSSFVLASYLEPYVVVDLLKLCRIVASR